MNGYANGKGIRFEWAAANEDDEWRPTQNLRLRVSHSDSIDQSEAMASTEINHTLIKHNCL